MEGSLGVSLSMVSSTCPSSVSGGVSACLHVIFVRLKDALGASLCSGILLHESHGALTVYCIATCDVSDEVK